MSRVESLAVAIYSAAPAIVAKVTMVLVLAMMVALVMRRSSAARRHLVWFCALVASAALLVLAPVTRSIVITLPARAEPSVSIPEPPSASSAHRFDDVVHAPRTSMATGERLWMPVRTAPRQLSREATLELAVVFWIAGVIAFLGRFLIAHRRVATIVRRSRRSALSADVDVRVSTAVSSPFVFGVRRPVIVLPADAEQWTNARMQAVLKHERAHVERGDVASQSVGVCVCAVLWFHPLAWYALARLRAESESAADDRVLHSGTSSIDYASHLLDLARVSFGAAPSALPVVGMATPPLERRVRAMLDRSRSRVEVSRKLRLLSGSLAVLVMLPAGGLKIERAKPGVARSSRVVAPMAAATPMLQPSVVVDSSPSENVGTSMGHSLPSIATDTVATRPVLIDTTATVDSTRPLRIGDHPNFAGFMMANQGPAENSGAIFSYPSLAITQTPTSITLAVKRKTVDEFGRSTGVLDATLSLEDGSPMKGVFLKNGAPVRVGLVAMSWDGDTLMIRTAVPNRHELSGAVERFWLTADGKGLVAHSSPFGYVVNREVTDTLWRRPR